MEKEREFIVNGFAFENVEDAQEAEKECRKILFLESKIDYGDLTKVQAIYEKALRDEVFRTAVGLFYLKGMRDFLVHEEEGLDEILPNVPAPETAVSRPVKSAELQPRRQQDPKQAEKDYRFRVSVILNVLLVLAVIAMFFIALDADQPNILNYEREITNKYASWEQELTEREQAVREKELQFLREE